jgi:hypothetical protein
MPSFLSQSGFDGSGNAFNHHTLFWASVLPELTDQDLKDLGVALGHRRKMLRAIRDLGSVSV